MVSQAVNSRVIETKDRNGKANGWLLPIWSIRESSHPVLQVYLTTVKPGMTKGPHLHRKKDGLFCCIYGDADIITRDPEGRYAEHRNIGRDMRTVHVPAGWAAQIVCQGQMPALILNLPSAPYDPADECEVEGWRG